MCIRDRTNIDRDLSLIDNNLSKKSYSLLYINELMIKLLPKDAANEDLFNLYSNFIEASVKEIDMRFLLRSFELDLLDMLGYGINFQTDIDAHEPIEAALDYIFIAERGFKTSNKDSDFSGQDIIDIRNRNLVNVSSNKLKQLTQATIMFCLEGKDLNSRQIFRRLQK